MKRTILMGLAGTFFLALLSFSTSQQPKPWPVPDKYEKMKNPVKADAGTLAEGKALYNQHCSSCHGKKGKGDGSKAAQLDTDCGDFTVAGFQSQSDGAIFYKTFEGRKDMPSYKKKIASEEDIWKVVNYLRTLK